MPINPKTGLPYRITDDGKVRQHVYNDGHIVKLASKIAAQKTLGPNVSWNGKAWVTPPAPAPVNTTLPYDSTYTLNMAADQAQRGNQLAGLNRSETLDQTDTAEALRRMGVQRAQAQQGFNARASRQGSLLSGRAMQGFGYMDTGYQQRGNDMQDALARRAQQRTLNAQEINQGAGLYRQAQEQALRERAAQLAFNNRLALGRK